MVPGAWITSMKNSSIQERSEIINLVALCHINYYSVFAFISWDLWNTLLCYWYHALVYSFKHLRFKTHLLSGNYISGPVEGSENSGRYILNDNTDGMIVEIPYFFIQNLILYNAISLNNELFIKKCDNTSNNDIFSI